MMNAIADISLETILARLRAIAPAIRAEGVVRLAVFGSRARGDARPDSDLDLLVAPDPSKRFLWKELSNVIRLCEEATGLTPHVTMPSELTPRISERMADDLIEVF
jgi:uncharacterized protein